MVFEDEYKKTRAVLKEIINVDNPNENEMELIYC
jgi:hypothetical protein